ncbi:MAG: VacJ family lipoprotein [Gammaproteobacteria bacterium]|nr:VacJ family lipoprotein [Gammaproteobacteria bacterium]MBV8404145.1 VacJ family lipoprotein [Gammaproteobacteria bacterium]
MRSTIWTSLPALCLLVLCGCATLPPGSKRDPRDPWERVNRTSYKINDSLDRAIVKPVAKGYTHLPHPVQSGVHNFFDNLQTPVVIVNDLLQGQVKSFFSDIGRFLFNTTVGLGGLFDPATAAGMEKNDRDFGQTLGKWGVPKGPYLVIPVFGPYDVRDGIGTLTVDTFANPRNYTTFWVNTSLWLVNGVDRRARLLPLDATIQSAYDPYAFIRNAYLQNRDFKVNGQSQTEEEQEQKLMDEAAQDEGDSGTPPPQTPAPQTPGAAPPEQTPPGAPAPPKEPPVPPAPPKPQ